MVMRISKFYRPYEENRKYKTRIRVLKTRLILILLTKLEKKYMEKVKITMKI